MTQEQTVWTGHPSQVINLGVFLLCGVLVALALAVGYTFDGRLALLAVLPAAVAAWRWLDTRCRVYELTTERLRVRTGVFSRRTDDLELYRVKDTTLLEPLLLRAFSLGNVIVTTHDVTTPTLIIPAVWGASALREQVRRYVEARRDAKGVRVAELE